MFCVIRLLVYSVIVSGERDWREGGRERERGGGREKEGEREREREGGRERERERERKRERGGGERDEDERDRQRERRIHQRNLRSTAKICLQNKASFLYTHIIKRLKPFNIADSIYDKLSHTV